MFRKIKSIIFVVLVIWFCPLISNAYGADNTRANMNDVNSAPINGSWAPDDLSELDYFVIDAQNSAWWTWIAVPFFQYSWQHAGLYSGSDSYGSKSIIHALGYGFTVQETPASFFLKYSIDRVIWLHKDGIDDYERDSALDTIRNTVNEVYYPSNVHLTYMDPDDIDLENIQDDDKLYCAQLVHVTYDQLLNTNVVGWSVRPITPVDLVDSADGNEITNLYTGSNIPSIPEFNSVNSTQVGNASTIDDEDWWKINFFEPNKTYTIKTSKKNNSSIDTVLYLYKICRDCPENLFEKVAFNDDDNGMYSKIVFTTPDQIKSTHDYYVMVRGYKSSTGVYELNISADNPTLYFSGEIGCVNQNAVLFFQDLPATVQANNSYLYSFSGQGIGNDYTGDDISFEIEGTFNANNNYIVIDVDMYDKNDTHFRSDRAEGYWDANSSSMTDKNCELTYDYAAGCDVWFKLSL